MKADLLLTDGEIVVPGIGLRRGSVAVRDGRIVAVLEPGETIEAAWTYACRGRWIMPGLIDPHPHIGFGD